MTRIILTAAIFVICLFGAFGARQADDAIAAHLQADTVAVPKFVYLFNDFLNQHPRDANPETHDHVRKTNAKDVERWQDARAAWKELDDAYKRAGY
jgi:hypothetical protein